MRKKLSTAARKEAQLEGAALPGRNSAQQRELGAQDEQNGLEILASNRYSLLTNQTPDGESDPSALVAAGHNVLRKKMSNLTTITEFLLLGFPEMRELQILHFVVFLVVYLAALVGNLLIITAIALDRHLHTPMYFFLMNLSIIDIGSISFAIPKSMANSLMNTRSISYAGCIAQVFFLPLLMGTDIFLLTVMAYDHYVAFCQPLHYERVMNKGACVQMAAGAWASSVLNSALHNGNMLAISFCRVNKVDQFFCEIPQLLKFTCSDSYVIETGLIVCNVGLLLICFFFIIVSYVQIIITVLRNTSEQGRHKAFSTCLPHLTVVSLFTSTGGFAYLKPISSSTSRLDLVVAVLYTVVPPGPRFVLDSGQLPWLG
ncbi:olfactory receptor 14A16-like [Emydura macquarii macquarii]|uniref:olfactory receptor 14A16-like n=1 Tax=Emydura macquarii macquarii TaxID=1129001 RepID=UPI003529F3C0